MAKYIYDVDKITRYIDIHNQFQGGLKTVDTDDSLKNIYLREAENVSLSEFNFIEKRHGLHKLDDHKPWESIANAESKLQGYFEYYVNATTVHKIIAFEGHFYINQGTGWEKVLLFDTPTGEVIDLSGLGIYTSEDVEASTDFASTISFGTQAPWFYTGNPNGVQLGVQGQIIHSTSGTIYVNNGGTSLNTVWLGVTGAAFPFPGGLTQGDKYYDTRTDRLYIWNNSTGTQGILTLLTDVYAADFQTTRPIDGLRIDDKLYIATGTYPVYYQGDGKIYVFPQYQMSDLDMEDLGYDLNTVDLEAALTNNNIPENSSHSNVYNGVATSLSNPIIVKEKQWVPRIPHVGSTLNFEVAYHLYNDGGGTYWDTNFTSVGGITTTNGGSYGSYTSSGGAYIVTTDKTNYVIYPRVYKKPSGIQGSEYTEISYTELEFVYLTNDENSAVIATGEYDQIPLTSAATLPNMSVTLRNITSGYWDYRVDIVIEATGFTPGFGFEVPTVQRRIIRTQPVEFTNIQVTPEELTDYKEEPYTSLKVHTCNRITEHNGRLCLFGSTTHPDWIFFSTIGAKEYFPYSHALQFTNELQEPVTAITKFMNILVVQSPSYTFGIKGDAPFPLSALEGEIYRKITINPTIGCIAPKSVKNVRNQLYFLSKEGIFTLRALFAEDLRYNVDPIDRNIYNIVPRDTDAVAAYFDDQYWLHFPQSGETLRYYVDKKAWVKDTTTAWEQFGGIHKFINESGKLRFITELSQLEDDEDLKVFDVEVDYSLPTDLTKNIYSKMTTSYLNQNYPFHPKNYKEAKFDFSIQNEYNTSMEELPISDYAETSNYVQFKVNLIDRHFYSITFEPDEITGTPDYIVDIDGDDVLEDTITVDGDNLEPIRFMSNKTGLVTVTITMTGAVNTTNMSEESIVLYDSTYDHSVNFSTIVLSEEGTLNIDPIDDYTQADVAVPIDLGTRTGNWTFGTSNFGNVIVAVKTVKLSGRGYNSKISIVEDSKSKWTLESLGITYKMKKARSR